MNDLCSIDSSEILGVVKNTTKTRIHSRTIILTYHQR